MGRWPPEGTVRRPRELLRGGARILRGQFCWVRYYRALWSDVRPGELRFSERFCRFGVQSLSEGLRRMHLALQHLRLVPCDARPGPGVFVRIAGLCKWQIGSVA